MRPTHCESGSVIVNSAFIERAVVATSSNGVFTLARYVSFDQNSGE